MRVFARSSTITKAYLLKVVEVHIGNRFVELEVNKKMIGGKFGDYAITKRLGSYIHKKKKKKKFKKMVNKRK
jgi:ribosomal protein S19